MSREREWLPQLTGQDSCPGCLAPRSCLLFGFQNWVGRKLLNIREREKSMEAQGTLSSSQTLPPEAVRFSVSGLGGPMECPARPPTAVWQPGQVLPSWEQEQAGSHGGLGVSLAVSHIMTCAVRNGSDVWWACSAHSVLGGFCLR